MCVGGSDVIAAWPFEWVKIEALLAVTGLPLEGISIMGNVVQTAHYAIYLKGDSSRCHSRFKNTVSVRNPVGF